MADLIDRQAAIDAVESADRSLESKQLALYAAIDNISLLPSAQPERKKGKWIDYTEDGFVECPYCHSATNCDGNKAELHYCFSCGAEMRGEE